MTQWGPAGGGGALLFAPAHTVCDSGVCTVRHVVVYVDVHSGVGAHACRFAGGAMGVDDLFLFIVCTIFMGAWIESVGGRRIRVVWGRVYDWTLDAIRPVPTHLRGRKPVECGEGRETDCIVTHGEIRPESIRCYWDAEAKELAREVAPPLATLMANRKVSPSEQVAMAHAHMANQMDLVRLVPGYDVRSQTVNGVPIEALLAQGFDVRCYAQVGMEPLRPTPAENARRYAAEGGTW